MSMNISGLGNTYNGINTNSKQYKALKEKGWLSGIMQNEAMMSPEERMIYETFGGRDTIIKNLMKQFDSEGYLLAVLAAPELRFRQHQNCCLGNSVLALLASRRKSP